MRNITESMLKSNNLDEATAPTGVAVSLIDGKIHFRSFKIPVCSKNLYNPTTLIVITNTEVNKLRYDTWRNIFLFIMDEDSMASRTFLAWFRHMIEERRAVPLIETNRPEDDDLPDVDATPFPSSMYERSWGSIVLVYYVGDYHQLPHVRMTPISDL